MKKILEKLYNIDLYFFLNIFYIITISFYIYILINDINLKNKCIKNNGVFNYKTHLCIKKDKYNENFININ